MYKLVIVDDEEEVRQGIIQKIEWSKYGFEVAGEAENGREALDLIEDCSPDVVITDITMPLLDGLELSAILQESFPTIKTVILTGFDDFKFAQQAIKYGVADYILKPVLPKDINEVILKLKTRIDEEIAEREDIKKLREHYIESLPIIKNKFLTLLITSKLKIDEIKKKISYFDLNLDGGGFAVAAISIDGHHFIEKSNTELDNELMKFAVLNISQEIMDKHSLGEVFFHDENLVIITRFVEFDKTKIFNKSYSVLDEIRQCTEKYLKTTITIGLGNICDSPAKFNDSYKSASSALDYKLVMGGNKVIFIEDLEPHFNDTVVFDENKERMLVGSIKFGSEDEVKESINTLFKDIAGLKTSFKDCQLYLMEILAAISRILRDFELDTGDFFGDDFNLFIEIFKFSTVNEIRDWIEGICIKLMKYISYKRQNTTKMLLEKAINYINQNYGDEELSIQKVSNYLHISPSYLSMIFKKETGETFLNHLIRMRMEVSKELLCCSEMKISEIAERIGYPALNYFSYFFKKNYGVSPREFRNNFLQKKES